MNGYIEKEVNSEECYRRSPRIRESDILDWNFDLTSSVSDKITITTSYVGNYWIPLYRIDTHKRDLEIKFNELSKKWQEETGLLSISKQKVNDTFLEIISMGSSVIPLILKEIKLPYSTSSWHIALKALAHFSPVSEQELGDSRVVKLKWIEWGEKHNLI